MVCLEMFPHKHDHDRKRLLIWYLFFLNSDVDRVPEVFYLEMFPHEYITNEDAMLQHLHLDYYL